MLEEVNALRGYQMHCIGFQDRCQATSEPDPVHLLFWVSGYPGFSLVYSLIRKMHSRRVFLGIANFSVDNFLTGIASLVITSIDFSKELCF
jgi:hypothetical protein